MKEKSYSEWLDNFVEDLRKMTNLQALEIKTTLEKFKLDEVFGR